MESPVNVNVIGLLNSYNNEGTRINTVNNNDATHVIDDSLKGMKSQAEDLRVWFAAARERYPAKASDFRRLLEMEDEIITAISSGSSTPSNFHNNMMDIRVNAILNIIFGESTPIQVDFKKYFDAYAKGQYLGTRDWNTDTTALTAANAEFTTLIGAARTAAEADDSVGSIRELYYNWSNGRGSSISKYNSKSNGDGPEDGVFKNELMSIMKTKIVGALCLTGVTKADKKAEALIIQLGQDNEEFRALIDDFQKANELHTTDPTGWPYDLTNALGHNYTMGY
jgi:hypothetical protein